MSAEAPPVTPPVIVSRRRPALRSLALNGLFVLACLYTLRIAREFFLPLALGLVLYFVLLPAVRALRRLRVPEPVGAGLVLGALSAFALGRVVVKSGDTVYEVIQE